MQTAHTESAVQIDEGRMTRFHWRIVITAGMGFFTDAYDLFIIGVVTAILQPIWHLSMGQLALLNGASLAAAAFGAILFGMLSDKFGRKKLYGLEVAILFFGAIFSAIAPSFVWLLIARIIVGLGIGGDYPSSAVVASEHSTTKHRGFLVLLVFAMQAIGLIVGPLLASVLLVSGLPHDDVWRILLGLGAIPAGCVFYMRRRIEESPHYLRTKESPLEVSRVVHDLAVGEAPVAVSKRHSLLDGKWLRYMLGTAGAWFLLDVAFYGNGISSVLIIDTFSPDKSVLDHTLISAVIFLVCAVPGYFAAARYVDRIGRRTLQILGFAMMALCYALIGGIPHLTHSLGWFTLIFGVSFFFVNFGPNTTTFLIPSEIYPTAIRATAHGWSAAIGKVGAFVGAFILPFFLRDFGMAATMSLMSLVSLLGIAVTMFLPEMKNISLAVVDQDAQVEAG